MTNMKKGFTLIELLVVVGILGILAIAALIAINPQEAQRKTRDATRIKDIATLQSVIMQYISDVGPTSITNRNSTNNSGSNACASTGWMGLDVCNYVSVIPRDPLNGRGVNWAPNTGSTRVTGTGQYGFTITAQGEYGVSARMESLTNQNKMAGDGVADAFVSAYSVSTAVATF